MRLLRRGAFSSGAVCGAIRAATVLSGLFVHTAADAAVSGVLVRTAASAAVPVLVLTATTAAKYLTADLSAAAKYFAAATAAEYFAADLSTVGDLSTAAAIDSAEYAARTWP